MKHIVMVLGFVMLSAGFALAEDEQQSLLSIENPYAYATTSVQKNGAVFMTIHVDDKENAPNTLIRAETNVADRVELHTHLMEDGVMMMREVEGYEIKDDEPLVLEPMGHHIMLFGLKAPLEAESEFPVTLYFDDDSSREVTVKVVKPGDMH